MSLPGYWRHVSSGYDGESTSEMLCCGSRTAAYADGEIRLWKVCPFCGASLVQKLDCRSAEMPRWVWDRFKDREYDVPWGPGKHPMPYWSIERRSAEWGNPEEWRAWEETSKLWNSDRTRALDELRSLIYHEIEEGYQPYAVQYRLRYGSQTFEPKWAVIQEHQYEEQ